MLASRFVAGSVLLLAFLQGLPDQADARQWRTTPRDMANDYVTIVDQRSDNELVMVAWLASRSLAIPQEDTTARAIVRKNMLVMVVHGHISDLGVFTFTDPTGVQVQTSKGEVRQPIPEEAWSPVLTGVVTLMQAMFSQGMGQFGRGVKLFVFDPQGIQECQKGNFWINYTGVQYDYKTPIPGCE